MFAKDLWGAPLLRQGPSPVLDHRIITRCPPSLMCSSLSGWMWILLKTAFFFGSIASSKTAFFFGSIASSGACWFSAFLGTKSTAWGGDTSVWGRA